MKESLVISLDEKAAAFLSEQGQIDPSEYINNLLKEEQKRKGIPSMPPLPETPVTEELQKEMEDAIPAAG